MKKLFTFALAAATLIGFGACSNDEENALSDKGYINLNVTTDDMVATRATQNATVADWYALVSVTGGDIVYHGTTDSDFKLIGTDLATTPLAAGSYNVAVRNYPNDAAWIAANEGFGAAYYEGNASSQTVTAGQTKDVDIACGKAQNAKFSIVSSGFSGTALTVNVTHQASSRTLSFDKACTTIGTPTNTAPINTDAFFAAEAELTYTIHYTINSITKEITGKTFKLGAAGSASTLTIASNQNGTIKVSITYDNEFTTGESSTINIDAATGVEI